MTTKTKATFTPGPWMVDEPLLRGGMVASITVPGSTSRIKLVLAHVDDTTGFNGDPTANARLIAASPDLLAACEEALHLHRCATVGGTPRLGPAAYAALLRAAIAKATGA